MEGALRFRTPWVAATGCALCAALLVAWEWFLVGTAPEPPPLPVLLAPPMTFAAVLLLWVRPSAGALVTVLGYGLTTDSAAWLPGTLVTFYLLGRREPAWRGWALVGAAVVAFALGARLSTSELLASVVYGAALFGGFWGLGRAVRYRAERAAAARAAAERTAAEDPHVLAAAAVAHERERLGAELVSVVRRAVDAMRDDARRASTTLDTDDIALIARRGSAAVTDMRRMLGLLRETEEPFPASLIEPGQETREQDRREWLDVVAAVAVGALAATEIVATPEVSRFDGGALALWPVLLLAAAVAVRRRWTAASAVLLVGAAAASLLPGTVSMMVAALPFALALLEWTAGSRGRRPAWAAFGGAVVAVAVVVGLAEPTGLPVLSVPVAAALTARAWSLRETEQEAHERRTIERRAELDAAAARARAEERRRVALELHDVTSHALGVMVLLAGAAEATVGHDPEVARASLGQVVKAGDAALAELDRLAAAVGPPPDPSSRDGLPARIAELAERMRSAGLQVDVQVLTEPMDPDVAHAAYRVAQEGLTNAARHAPGSRAAVRVTPGEGGVTVIVENGPPTSAPMGSGSGFGLAGTAERIRTMGGSLAGEATSDGGYVLRAQIPVSASRSAVSPPLTTPG